MGGVDVGGDDDLGGVIEQGIGFLQKPFLPETLVIRVDELLASELQGHAVGEP